MLRKFLILYGVSIISIVLVVSFSIVFWNINFDTNVATTLVTIVFSLFGFSLTSFSIILSFTNKSGRVLSIFNKGYNKAVVVDLILLFIYSNISLFLFIFNFRIGLLVALFLGSIILVGYYIYFISALVLNRKD